MFDYSSSSSSESGSTTSVNELKKVQSYYATKLTHHQYQNMTNEEIAKWTNLFNTEHPNGKISLNEFIEMSKKFSNENCATKKPDNNEFIINEEAIYNGIFNIFDKNKTGYLVLDDYLRIINFFKYASKNPYAYLLTLFQCLDVKQDGVLDSNEIEIFLIKLYTPTPASTPRDSNATSSDNDCSGEYTSVNIDTTIKNELNDVLSVVDIKNHDEMQQNQVTAYGNNNISFIKRLTNSLFSTEDTNNNNNNYVKNKADDDYMNFNNCNNMNAKYNAKRIFKSIDLQSKGNLTAEEFINNITNDKQLFKRLFNQ